MYSRGDRPTAGGIRIYVLRDTMKADLPILDLAY